jgi:hypothetical protein
MRQLIEPPTFIVGAARSGTTWVYDILHSHHLVAGVYESWIFTPGQGLGVLFSESHWPASRSGLGRLIARDEFIVELRDFVGQLFSQAIESEHQFLVEKSPSHLYVMEIINEVFPGSRFIHVLRDGRDVSVSVRAAANSWVPTWKQTFGRSIYSSARAWKHAVACCRAQSPDLAERFLEVRYEDLKSDPQTWYRAIFAHCRVPVDDAVVQATIEATDFDANYQLNEAGFRRRGRSGDWRRYFNALDSIMFNLAAGDALIEAGYEENRRWMSSLLGRR